MDMLYYEMIMVSVPGLETGIHVFFGLFAILASTALASIIYTGSTNKKLINILAIATALFVWISWFSVINVYTVEYAADKAVILKYQETALAHEFGMETKEHIFYSGLFLATLLPILSYTIDINKQVNRRLIFWIAIAIVIGGIIMEMLGGWISIAAKQAWAFER